MKTKTDTGITEKLANLTESQTYMALEFEKMQEDMKVLRKLMLHL